MDKESASKLLEELEPNIIESESNNVQPYIEPNGELRISIHSIENNLKSSKIGSGCSSSNRKNTCSFRGCEKS